MDDRAFTEAAKEVVATLLRLFPDQAVAVVVLRQSGQMNTLTNVPAELVFDFLTSAAGAEIESADLISRGGMQ